MTVSIPIVTIIHIEIATTHCNNHDDSWPKYNNKYFKRTTRLYNPHRNSYNRQAHKILLVLIGYKGQNFTCRLYMTICMYDNMYACMTTCICMTICMFDNTYAWQYVCMYDNMYV